MTAFSLTIPAWGSGPRRSRSTPTPCSRATWTSWPEGAPGAAPSTAAAWSSRAVVAHRRRGRAARDPSPQAFRNTTLADVLRETVLGAGADLAADLGDLSAAVTAWHRRAAPATHTLADVARAAGRVRALNDGTLWCGADAWTAQTIPRGWRGAAGRGAPRSGATARGRGRARHPPGRTIALDGADVRVGLSSTGSAAPPYEPSCGRSATRTSATAPGGCARPSRR